MRILITRKSLKHIRSSLCQTLCWIMHWDLHCITLPFHTTYQNPEQIGNKQMSACRAFMAGSMYSTLYRARTVRALPRTRHLSFVSVLDRYSPSSLCDTDACAPILEQQLSCVEYTPHDIDAYILCTCIRSEWRLRTATTVHRVKDVQRHRHARRTTDKSPIVAAAAKRANDCDRPTINANTAPPT